MSEYQIFVNDCLYVAAVPPLEVPTVGEWGKAGYPDTYEQYCEQTEVQNAILHVHSQEL